MLSILQREQVRFSGCWKLEIDFCNVILRVYKTIRIQRIKVLPFYFLCGAHRTTLAGDKYIFLLNMLNNKRFLLHIKRTYILIHNYQYQQISYQYQQISQKEGYDKNDRYRRQP